jgi:hypothetical protein
MLVTFDVRMARKMPSRIGLIIEAGGVIPHIHVKTVPAQSTSSSLSITISSKIR